MTLLGIHWLRPWFILILLPAIAICILLLKRWQQQHTWRDYCDPHLLPQLLTEKRDAKHHFWFAWLLLFWLVCTLALMGPSWQRLTVPVYQTTDARVIVLDLSNSMLANDLAPSRLQRAKYKILDLLREIKQGQTAMVVFSSEAFVVSPLTDDSNTIATMVPTIDTSTVPVQGDNIASGIQQAGKLLQQGGAQHGQIILITDSTPNAQDYSVTRQLAADGYTTSVLGVGTEQGGPVPLSQGGFVTNKQGAIQFAKLNITALQQLASNGDGQYVAMTNNDSDVQALLHSGSLDQVKQSIKKTQREKVMWQDQGHWFIWAAIFILLLLSRRGWLQRILP